VSAPPRISLDLPYPPEECHPNRRRTTRGKMRAVRLAHEWVGFAVLTLAPPDPPWPRVRVRATWVFRDHRRRDGDNLNNWTKAYEDAIAAWLGIDDDYDHWRWDEPVIVVDPRRQPGVVIEIYPVESFG
jgi:hypothetical protein